MNFARTLAIALLAITLISVFAVALFGCGSSTSEGHEDPYSSPAAKAIQVTLPDGHVVTCVTYTPYYRTGAIACDFPTK